MTWSGQKVRYIWISTSQPRPGHQTHPQVGLAVAVLPLGVNLALDQHHRPPLPTASSAWQWGVRSLSWPLGCQTPTMSLMDLRTLPLPNRLVPKLTIGPSDTDLVLSAELWGEGLGSSVETEQTGACNTPSLSLQARGTWHTQAGHRHRRRTHTSSMSRHLHCNNTRKSIIWAN